MPSRQANFQFGNRDDALVNRPHRIRFFADRDPYPCRARAFFLGVPERMPLIPTSEPSYSIRISAKYETIVSFSQAARNFAIALWDSKKESSAAPGLACGKNRYSNRHSKRIISFLTESFALPPTHAPRTSIEKRSATIFSCRLHSGAPKTSIAPPQSSAWHYLWRPSNFREVSLDLFLAKVETAK